MKIMRRLREALRELRTLKVTLAVTTSEQHLYTWTVWNQNRKDFQLRHHVWRQCLACKGRGRRFAELTVPCERCRGRGGVYDVLTEGQLDNFDMTKGVRGLSCAVAKWVEEG